LGAHGLVRGSFVPPQPIRELRDLTRTRTAIIRERGREVQRLEKLLEDAGIKLSAVASDITGVSGRAMLEALIGGQRDPAVLADLAKRRLRSKIPALTEALTGRFTEHHAFLAWVHLDLIDRHTQAVTELTERIEQVIEPFQAFRKLICTIPGISTLVADVVIAETGADMSRFPAAGHLASWAGTCPGSNESAGRIKSTKTRPGNPYLKGALGTAAMAATQNNNTYLGAKYRRIAARHGPPRRSPRSNTPCSSRSGRWQPPARSTTTRDRTSTPSCTPNASNNAPSANSARSGMRSRSTPHKPQLRKESSRQSRNLAVARWRESAAFAHGRTWPMLELTDVTGAVPIAVASNCR
jgi:transposase